MINDLMTFHRLRSTLNSRPHQARPRYSVLKYLWLPSSRSYPPDPWPLIILLHAAQQLAIGYAVARRRRMSQGHALSWAGVRPGGWTPGILFQSHHALRWTVVSLGGRRGGTQGFYSNLIMRCAGRS